MKIKIFLLGAVILSAFIWFAYHEYFKYGKAIHVAFVGPLSGEGATAGRLMTQAIQLYFDKINERGGINGKKIILDKFDDQNDTTLAEQKATEIYEQNRAVAVIGHWYSSASISGGEIYKKHRIPAITPGSTNINVTKDNEWYFRNIYNANASGQFLANYVNKVFHLNNNVTIIRDNDSGYGSYLAEVFEQAARELNMEIKYNWAFQSSKNNQEEIFKQFVNQLKQTEEKTGAILLAVQAHEGIKLVKLIKDAGIQNPILSGSGFSEQTFIDGFNDFPKEKANPGYYTNDIYVATPLIFDTANEKAQKFKQEYEAKYDEPPDWSAAYAYDTAMVIIEALKKANIQGTSQTLREDRQKIRETLASFTNLYNALEGVTGFNYFNDNRDAQKPVSISVYKQKQSISALTQLQIMRNPNEINNLEKAHREEHVLLINDKYMYKTNVVYVGTKIFEISEIDMKNLLFTLDFKLWFRFQKGNFRPDKVEFLNAVEPEKIQQQLEIPIEEKTKDNMTYLVYRIKSRFRADFISNYYAYKQHLVGFSFHHQALTRNNLIYVSDVLGMGLDKEKSLVNRLLKDHVLSPASGWTIHDVLFFPDIAKEYSGGDPDYINVPEGIVEYSRFNTAIRIKKDQFTLRGTLPYSYAYNLMISSGILFLLLTILASNNKQDFSKLIWFFQVIFAFVWLLSGEIIFADWLAENTNAYQMKNIIKMFDILWWIIPAFLLNIASERFIWTPLEEQVGPIPNIIRHFFALFVYFMAIIGITVFVYEQRFTSLLATSGVIAMIIGLAIQINISNVFSGIVINMERPFRIGDWVKIGDLEEGEIIDINWRATRLKRRDGCMVSIPNSQASETAIINFHYPDEAYWLWPTVYVHPRHPPMRVKKILLDALLSTDSILKQPEPIVFFTGINEWAATYWVAFCADDYANKNFILEEVWTRVWFHLNRAEIAPAVMRTELYVFKGDKGREFQSTVDATSLVPEMDTAHTDSYDNYETKGYIGEPAHNTHRFKTGKTIVQQG